ncbi:SiaB family protein kinase [Desulfoscipio sp. XC116]|uniref:SiaB family protein kinase n=1 Tax=Desulfoscipio sp. XC116 TaxID=3144975 RepID=UPI00325AE950
MFEKTLMDLQNHLKESGILISFSGRFSQGIIEELGDAIKKHMQTEDMPKNDIYNVFAIFVEQTHNIKNYTTDKEGSCYYDQIACSGIVTIGKSEGAYFICSGNLVEDKDVKPLAQKINQIMHLDKKDLKKLYKEQIRQELAPGSQGAGVGLIDIARKSKHAIKYSIVDIDGHLSFFSIKVTV